MQEQRFKTNKRKIATTSMAILGITLVVGGAFAALSDTLNHDETITIEWVDIVDGSTTNLALEDINDVNNTPVTELTPGITYELTGILENDSTVITDWVATDLTTTPGMSVNIADADGQDNPNAIGEDIDVAQFGITVTVNQSVTPSTDLNFMIEFSSTDARVMLAQPTAISTVFPDPALATCVANDLESGANGDVNALISQETLNNFGNLQCEGQGITNIEGLQYITNLRDLDLSNNQISDLSVLVNLTNLNGLELDKNLIVDITSLASLEGLEYLKISDNQINDISALSELTDLTILYLAHNEITDVTPLTNLTSLTYLHLSYNYVNDITPLANLTNLNYLYLYENDITNIEPIANLTNLTELTLGKNNISDITPLSGLTNLRNVNLSYNQISDLSPLASLTNLEYLYLYDNQITDLTPLAGLTNLKELTLGSNEITDITPLTNMNDLTKLYLESNDITDFSPLGYQPQDLKAHSQNVVLSDVALGTPTTINIDGIAGTDFNITFNTPGSYSNGQLTWNQTGVNSLTYTSSDGLITGTITQTVY